MLKTLSFKSLNWFSVTIFTELIQFGQGPKLRRKFSISLKKDFIFQFDIDFSASFPFYFLVSYTYSQTSAISFNIEALNSGENPPL